MFCNRRLAVFCALALALFSACVTEKSPPVPAPSPTPVAVHGYHLTLYDVNGQVTKTYDLGPNDIIRDDPLHQEIWFRVNGQEKHFHGTYDKGKY